MLQYNKMSGLNKRREMFARQIRRREKDLIIGEIRAKLLAQDGEADKQSNLGPSIEGRGNIMAEFEEQMMQFIMSRFNTQGVKKEYFFGVALTVFIKQVKAIEHPQGIQHLTQCYRTAKALIQKHLDLTLEKQWPNECDLGNYLESLNRWSHTFNIILLRIKIKSMIFPQEIFEIDEYFNQWISHSLEDLLAYEQADDLKLIMHGKDIKFTLKEIYSILGQIFESQRIQGQRTQETINFLQNIFSNKMIKLLVSSVRNPRLDDTCRLTIVFIFKEITFYGMKTIYHIIIDNDYIDYMRFTFAFQQGYKTKTKIKRKMLLDQQDQENQTRIVCKMCQFIVHAAQLDFSTQFWQKGVCSQMKAVERQGIKDIDMRCYIISTLYVCITSINEEKTLELIEEAEMFDWVLKVIDELIDLKSSSQAITDLINDGVDVIYFFLEIGKCNMNGATVNPYKIKLQYSCGEAILSRCEKGRALLQLFEFGSGQALNSC